MLSIKMILWFLIKALIDNQTTKIFKWKLYLNNLYPKSYIKWSLKLNIELEITTVNLVFCIRLGMKDKTCIISLSLYPEMDIINRKIWLLMNF